MENIANEPYIKKQPCYFPPELVNISSSTSQITYHCYLIELNQNFSYDVSVQDVVLAMRVELDSEIGCTQFDMCVDRGILTVNLRKAETIQLDPNQVEECRMFQISLFRILNLNKKTSGPDELCLGDDLEIDYLLLPATARNLRCSKSIIDWKTVTSVSFSTGNSCECEGHAHKLWTKNGQVCSCKLENSVVCTPHNNCIYILSGKLDMNGNSVLRQGKRKATTYKKFYEKQHGIRLCFEEQPLYKGKNVFKVQNYLLGCRQIKSRAPSNSSCELPPELCSIIMSPISIGTIYSFSFIPSIMHRLESLLVAFNLKRMLSDHCVQNEIPTSKVLEAITTRNCQESFNYDSFETLGDSFLKYAASQQLFKTYPNHREGLLTEERKKVISNVALCNLGRKCRLPGFIRNERFEIQNWVVPGNKSRSPSLEEELVSSRAKVYVHGRRKLKCKVVADVVEALIGAFLSTGGEKAALSFMNWIGIEVDFNFVPYNERHFGITAEELVDVSSLESLLNSYSFHDKSLLLEALTHSSYKRPGIPRCYEQLEFLGDAVLDYLITKHFYNEYPGMPSGLLTDLRSASVNDECYALSTFRAKLHKHILYDDKGLDEQIAVTVQNFQKLSLESTFGWESNSSFSKVLADVIESLAGAIFVDSRYNKEVVFQNIRPLLEPLVTPDTVVLQPVRKLTELCQAKHYEKKTKFDRNNGATYVTIEVKADEIMHEYTAMAANGKIAEKEASKNALESLEKLEKNRS